MTNCAKCGRPLKNPKSMEHGYGPECWSKIAAGIRKERTDNSANRSDYAYHINSKHGQQALVIEDLNRGGMSVTNNIEAIIAEIADEIGTSIYQMPIVYRDSEGQYDGINGEKLRSDTFYGIGAKEEKDAVKAAIERRTR
jgi:hypothetical protein